MTVVFMVFLRFCFQLQMLPDRVPADTGDFRVSVRRTPPLHPGIAGELFDRRQ